MGSTTNAASFVLVPGAGGDGRYWNRLVSELEARGYEAVAVDLPGADDTAGLDVYADHITAAAAGLDQVILVAQSMGALSAPLVCDRLPVALLLLVNAMIPRHGETGGEWWEATGQASAAGEFALAQGRDPAAGLDPMEVFFHDLPAEVLRDVLEGGERDQSGTPFEQPFPLERWPEVPTRAIAGRDDRLFPADFQRQLALDRLGIVPDEIPGGHLVALSQPVALADRLETYVFELDDGRSRPANTRNR